jgi:hypothetical protein
MLVPVLVPVPVPVPVGTRTTSAAAVSQRNGVANRPLYEAIKFENGVNTCGGKSMRRIDCASR